MMAEKTILKGRLDGSQRNRLKNLFNMMYKPFELAEELGINKNHIYRVYIPLGCPHKRDELNRIWINGEAFKDWYIEKYRKQKLKENQSFCKTCRKGVEIVNPERKEKNGVEYILSNCPKCNRRLTKIVSNKWMKNK